ncbi:MAG: TerC family protein [Planctomycetes bacterium]|nr:TerC family protein [Planctomycetota bacterium]
MPRRPFPVLVLSVGLAALVLTAVRPLFAQPPPAPGADPPKFPEVRVEPTGGGATVEGRLKLVAVTLKTETGSTTVEMSHVRRITLTADAEGKLSDTVQLTDKSIVRGRVVGDQFKLETSVGETTVKRADVREIKVVNEEKAALVAIFLGLLTLTAMEIVLGVDNIIFLAIIAGKLPKEQQPRARKLGLMAALGTRIGLLLSLSFLLGLTAPIFTLPELGFLHDTEAREISWRDLILFGGGLFLIGKSTFEMHEKLEHARAERDGQPVAVPAVAVSFAKTIITIAVIDIVFSLDSVITAVGMVEQVWVMIVAMVLAMLVMLYFAGPIADFVDRHPTIKVLALSFLILIGVMLVAEGLGQHIDKGYIYAAMAFALVVEMINMRLRGPKAPKDEHETKPELPKVPPPPPKMPPRPAGS